MLLVKTKLAPSKINGIGVFAAQKIPKGTITWRFDPKFDRTFTPKEVSKLSKIQFDLINHCSYLSKKTNRYIYCMDDSRFTNHSNKPNMDNSKVLPGDLETCDIANRDIKAGEELTVDYRIIDVNEFEE